MPEASLVLTATEPWWNANGDVVLGVHRRELVIVDAYPAQANIGVFVQLSVGIDEPGDVELELWTQDLHGEDVELRGAAAVAVAPAADPTLPREYVLVASVGYEITAPMEWLLALKVNGEVAAQRLLVSWRRPNV